MSIKKEGSLRIPVIAWLNAQGMTPVFEVGVSGGYCDIVGVEFFEKLPRVAPSLKQVVAVELKLDDVGGVLSQSQRNRINVMKSYAAMPKKRIDRMRQVTLDQFREAGIGLLSVDGRVEEVVPAAENAPDAHTIAWLSRKLWRRRDEWAGRVTRAVYSTASAKAEGMMRIP